MKHHIIVKFSDQVTDKAALSERISKLYAQWHDYPFIKGCELLPNCVDRSNRYDLMIVLDIDRADLELWDNCRLHKSWKSEFGGDIGSKAIFDCE